MSERILRAAAWGVATATTVLTVLGLLQEHGLFGGEPLEPAPDVVEPFIVVALVAPTVVGLLIAHRKPRNLIAWLLLVGAFSVIAPYASEFVLSDGWALQVSRATWPLLYAWPVAVAFVFPNGRLLSHRWRWIAGATIFCFVGFTASGLLDPGPHWEPHEDVPNPIAGNAVGELLLASRVWIALWLGILASLFAGAIAIRLRLRRATGDERLQTLWLAWAAVLIPIGLLICAASGLVFPGSFIEWVVFPWLLLTQAAIAVSVGAAVARYGLYSIERLMNRTLVYGAVTILLAGAYAGVTVGLGVVVGRGSAWVTAAATLAVAFAFRPLRGVIQSAVDRRFSRARYDAVRQVRAFEDEVRENRRAPEAIGDVLRQALQDPRAELLFWLPESEAYATAIGEVVGEIRDDERARTPIDRDGGRTALLLHDPALLGRPDLLTGVVAAAALSIEIARLRVEVRLQLAEVEASRTRIVEAGYEERRRLERDLHDGAQQRLVSLGLRLRRLQRSLPREAEVLAPALDQVVDEVGDTITDLRQIAAGVRPARLDEGLAAAFADLARTAPVPVQVDAPAERAPASIEAAAYFVACEALTNAVKHASASKVALRAVRDNGTLLVTVADDGVGGAVARRGSGLSGLHDRVAAHGGTLTIASPPGGGTRVEVALPCES